MSMGAAISLTIVAAVPLLMLGMVIAATVMAWLKDRRLAEKRSQDEDSSIE